MDPKVLNKYSESDVINANINVYKKNSVSYDDTIIKLDSYKRLECLISNAIKLLSNDTEKIQALDACGGTGNAAIILNKLGCTTSLVDLSNEMIERFNIKCKKIGLSIDSTVSEINTYLQTSEKSFDLIVFSSSLHHLRYPDRIMSNALKLLNPGGIIITVADPTINVRSASFKYMSLIDRIINHTFNDHIGLLDSVKNKINTFFKNNKRQNESGNNNDWLSEFYAQTGIDDHALKASIISNGGFILSHKRYTGGYTSLFQYIYKKLKLETSFFLMVSNTEYLDPNFNYNDYF